jgi:hypothetical protein
MFALAMAVSLLGPAAAQAGLDCDVTPNDPRCAAGVPLPSSLMLIVSGVAGLAGVGWWIRRK